MKKKHLKELAEIIVHIKDEREAERFLKNILTPRELEEVVLRPQILKMLKSGIPQREIAKTLDIAIGTVNRGSKELQKRNPKFIKTA